MAPLVNRERVLFIGIGNMGWPMAARLHAGGFRLSVNDTTEERVRAFADQVGGRCVRNPADDAGEADVIITMLPTSRHVAAVMDGLRPSLRAGQIVIEMTSGVPSITQSIATNLSQLGVSMVDAPVSGGVPRAVSGDLTIMAGGNSVALDQVDSILRAMGSTIHRIGPIGSGQAMKALNNLVSAGGFLIGIEALIIGQKFGIEASLMTDVLNASTGMNNSTQKKFKQFVLSRKFDSGFGLDLMVKDLSIALGIARDVDAASPFASLCRELSAAAAALLGPGQDHTALAKLSETLSGTELGATDR
ncbi:NAD(P)-dependent oxidoreductase [Bradyrhizobium tunisiense]|uniref:NAD(P)-dependent oxidoreductase n=1 Tax=Bradyrhizobium tunisiense TaxID=3278709 RepID=UPI0035DFA5F1